MVAIVAISLPMLSSATSVGLSVEKRTKVSMMKTKEAEVLLVLTLT